MGTQTSTYWYYDAESGRLVRGSFGVGLSRRPGEPIPQPGTSSGGGGCGGINGWNRCRRRTSSPAGRGFLTWYDRQVFPQEGSDDHARGRGAFSADNDIMEGTDELIRPPLSLDDISCCLWHPLSGGASTPAGGVYERRGPCTPSSVGEDEVSPAIC